MIAAGKMPPPGSLLAGDVGAIRAWIAAGAAYPKEPLTPSFAAMMPLWSMQPVLNPPAPRTRFDSLARNPIDRFVFQKLERAGLSPSSPASRLALLRRVTVDLTGLPPTPEEADAFVTDKS